MAARIRYSDAERKFTLARVALGVTFGGIVACGCLNPVPDDYPSRRDVPGEGATGQPTPIPNGNDECSGNPLDSSCDGVSPPSDPVIGAGEESRDGGVDSGALDSSAAESAAAGTCVDAGDAGARARSCVEAEP